MKCLYNTKHSINILPTPYGKERTIISDKMGPILQNIQSIQIIHLVLLLKGLSCYDVRCNVQDNTLLTMFITMYIAYRPKRWSEKSPTDGNTLKNIFSPWEVIHKC